MENGRSQRAEKRHVEITAPNLIFKLPSKSGGRTWERKEERNARHLLLPQLKKKYYIRHSSVGIAMG
jgi:hypothetical protein